MKRKERLSNMELLRLVAMFMVMALHANFFALCIPSAREVSGEPLRAFTRCVFEGLCIVSVDVFVLLSGWFGIRPSLRGFLALVFQCLFFSFVLWGAGAALGMAQRTPWQEVEAALTFRDWWFVRCYIGLYVVAPALNLFADRVPRGWQTAVLALFFAAQTATGFLTHLCPLFDNGYSVLSFAGLYLLARHLRRFPCKPLALPAACHFALYALLAAANAAAAFLYARHTSHPVSYTFFDYTNPLVIGAALALLLGFSRITLKSTAVNTLAASAFAIYLFHTHPLTGTKLFIPTAHRLFRSHSGAEYLALTLLFLLAVALAAIAADRVRLLLWHKMLASAQRKAGSTEGDKAQGETH